MNNKLILWGVGALAVLGMVYLLVRPASPPAPEASIPETTSTTPGTTDQPSVVLPHSEPTFQFGTGTTTTQPAFALFDSKSFTSTSTYPTVTGTANVSKVGIVVSDSADVGIVGTTDIAVTGGRWSYTSSVALKPGTYKLMLAGGKAEKFAELIVK